MTSGVRVEGGRGGGGGRGEGSEMASGVREPSMVLQNIC